MPLLIVAISITWLILMSLLLVFIGEEWLPMIVIWVAITTMVAGVAAIGAIIELVERWNDG